MISTHPSNTSPELESWPTSTHPCAGERCCWCFLIHMAILKNFTQWIHKGDLSSNLHTVSQGHKPLNEHLNAAKSRHVWHLDAELHLATFFHLLLPMQMDFIVLLKTLSCLRGLQTATAASVSCWEINWWDANFKLSFYTVKMSYPWVHCATSSGSISSSTAASMHDVPQKFLLCGLQFFLRARDLKLEFRLSKCISESLLMPAEKCSLSVLMIFNKVLKLGSLWCV